MRLSIIQTLLALTLASTAASTYHMDKEPQSEELDYSEALEGLKQQLRRMAAASSATYNISHFNMTLDAKRRLLKLYRAKLEEINGLDEDGLEEPVHRRLFFSYPLQEENHLHHYQFNVAIPQPDDYRKETYVQSAELKIYRRTIPKTHFNQTSVRNIGLNGVLFIYQRLPHDMRRLVTSKVISLANSGWISIDVRDIVQSWVDEPGLNFGIEIEGASFNVSHILYPAVYSDDAAMSEYPTTLDIYAYEKSISTQRRRQRRVADDEICQPGKCCREAVNITLADVGMFLEGVHQPGDYFTAYMCNGRCPRNYKLHNNWSNIKNTLRNTRGATHLRNTCAPTAYEKGFRHYHFNSAGVMTFTEYDDVIVSECGCV